ncbi:Succinate dehydrogenase [ubiquinone] cytochrome b small subunit, mitochondrial [Halotydeus destructor]|nr:Succinate dehydrogenase [ubiquinone] cytochrome b small subunit, mitochondrial [Halotydeus destructor]
MSALIGFRSCLALRSGLKALQCRSLVHASTVVNNKFDKPIVTRKTLPLSSISLRNSSAGSHSGLWTAERLLSAGLLAVLPAAFVLPLPGMDYALALALTTHVHWGVEAIVVDYIRPAIFGDVIPKIALGLVYLLSALTLGGLFYFNYTDVGVAHGIRMAWKQL